MNVKLGLMNSVVNEVNINKIKMEYSTANKLTRSTRLTCSTQKVMSALTATNKKKSKDKDPKFYIK